MMINGNKTKTKTNSSSSSFIILIKKPITGLEKVILEDILKYASYEDVVLIHDAARPLLSAELLKFMSI